MKLDIFRQIFEKYSNIKFHENPSSGSRVVPRGQTDRHEEANSCFFAIFRKGLKKSYTVFVTFVLFHPEYFRLSALTFPLEWLFRLWISNHLHGWSSCRWNWNVRTNVFTKPFRKTVTSLRRIYMFVVYAGLVLQSLHSQFHRHCTVRYDMRRARSSFSLFPGPWHSPQRGTDASAASAIQPSFFIPHLSGGIPLLCACPEVR